MGVDGPSLFGRGTSVGEKEAMYVGIDGGQSGTRCMVIDGKGNILGAGKAGRIDFVLAPGGKEKLHTTLTAALKAAIPEADFSFVSVFLGLSGVVAGGALEQAVKDVCQKTFSTQYLAIDNDAFIAWAGALECSPGIVLIAGSGSIALGVNSNREVARAGGWGYLFGDEGGGFGIARDALKMTLHSIDINRPIESFIEAFTQEFPSIPIEELGKALYAGRIDRPDLAAVTKRLAHLAALEDRDALELFARSAHMLAAKIIGTGHKLAWPSSVIQWSPVGGVFKSGDTILAPIQKYLTQDKKYQYQMVLPALPPVAGAALLALEQQRPIVPEILTNLKRQVEIYPEL